MFTVVLNDAFKDSDAGIILKYRADGKLFKLRRNYYQNEDNSFRDFSFANDCALNAGSELEIQVSMDKFSMVCDNFGLTVHIKTTEAMHQLASHAPYIELKITIKG